MKIKTTGLKIAVFSLFAAVLALSAVGEVGLAAAQAGQASAPAAPQTGQLQPLAAPPSEYFAQIYRDFYNNYRLGPADEIAIRVVGQPDYTFDHVKISPTGNIYHPLAGDIDVAGLTVDQLARKLSEDFAQYVINPKVSVALLVAQSAKVGVLGEVARPGIVVMTEPMTVLGVISASGGVTDSGSKSEVTLLRQGNDGRLRTVTVNLKHILEGKADPDDNLVLRAGDTLIVHTNVRKKITNFTGLAGFAQFLAYLALAR